MAPSRWIKFLVYTVVLTITLLLNCSVAVLLEHTTEKVDIPRKARSHDAVEKAATSTRFLRSGRIGSDVANAGVNNEARGTLSDKLFSIPLLKFSLAVSMDLKDEPAKVLQIFKKYELPMRENVLLLWMGYVQKYRTKMGTSAATDAYVIKTLKDFIPESQLSRLLNAMEKNEKLRSFGEHLKKVATNTA